ncbi:MAG: hypothetical protein KGH64_04865, partial [Candidatus Micrarchaeota archaeon]|nr:hypothetical protein [Candidatus Micrarchaeota archaeon]
GELMPLPHDFYNQVQELLGTISNKETGEYSSVNKTISLLKEKRTQKLLVYIAYSKQLPAPLPSEEEALYIQIKKIVNSSTPEAKSIKIKVSKSIPQVITPKGNSIGPFEQNQTVFLSDISDVKFIVDNKIGEIVN